MSQLIDNLNIIESVKTDIKSALENKGVDMTGVSFGSYADKIGEITTSFVTVPLNVSANGTYNPGEGIDGYSQVVVDVPQSVTGYTQKELTEGICITDLNNSASFVVNNAFYNNSCLTTVDLPMCDTVGYQAFQSCKSLQTVSLPACTTVGDRAFSGCKSLQTVFLPACTTVSKDAFQSCKSLQTVFLPACTTVGNNTFEVCTSLQTVSLPACTSIGWYVFRSCSSLQTVSLPACTSIGWNAFQNCTSLSSIDLPMCSYIGNQAFQNCYSLSVVYIGTGIDIVCVLNNSIVFSNCSALTSIYVPASLVESYKTATNWTYYSDKIVGI